MKRHKKGLWSIKRWRIGDYLRQFSIVAAGVMVTFVGSDMISNYATQKEIKSSMHLIIDELEKNKEEVNITKLKYELDRTMAGYLIDSGFVIDKFPIDTLKKYSRLVSNISSFFYSDDALEVLKSSALMQKIEDKAILLSIIEAYKLLYEIQQSIKEYYNLKSTIIVDISLNNDMNHNGSLDSTWKMYFANNSMRSFCGIAHSFVNYDYFDDKSKELDATIKMLRQTYP